MERTELTRTEPTNNSEVARLRNRITLEYQAAMRAMYDTAITAPHKFITRRMEIISECKVVALIPVCLTKTPIKHQA